MATKSKYHKILGIPGNATDKEIRDAYRRLAMKYHPDRNSGNKAEEKFKEIREAYAVLSGREKPPPTHAPRPDGRNRQYSWANDVVRTWAGMEEAGHNNMYR